MNGLDAEKILDLALIDESAGYDNPAKLELDKKTAELLEREGIIGFAFLDFNTMLGPVLKYYYCNNGSNFVKKLKDNPASIAELSIVGKYANEFVTPSNEKLLIRKIVGKDEYGRDIPNYVIIELKGKKKRLAKNMLEKIAQSGRDANSVKRIIKKTLKYS